MNHYDEVFEAAVAILRGDVLQSHEVSAGRGKVIDWCDVRSGETILEGDVFDQAYLYVAITKARAAGPPEFWIRWTDPDGKTGYLLSCGVDTVEGRARHPREHAEEKAGKYQASSHFGTKYVIERAIP